MSNSGEERLQDDYDDDHPIKPLPFRPNQQPPSASPKLEDADDQQSHSAPVPDDRNDQDDDDDNEEEDQDQTEDEMEVTYSPSLYLPAPVTHEIHE